MRHVLDGEHAEVVRRCSGRGGVGSPHVGACASVSSAPMRVARRGGGGQALKDDERQLVQEWRHVLTMVPMPMRLMSVVVDIPAASDRA